MLFLENEAQIIRNNYRTMLFMSKQVSLPKSSWILQKIKISQNSIYALFTRSPSIIIYKSKPLQVVCWKLLWEGVQGPWKSGSERTFSTTLAREENFLDLDEHFAFVSIQGFKKFLCQISH